MEISGSGCHQKIYAGAPAVVFVKDDKYLEHVTRKIYLKSTKKELKHCQDVLHNFNVKVFVFMPIHEDTLHFIIDNRVETVQIVNKVLVEDFSKIKPPSGNEVLEGSVETEFDSTIRKLSVMLRNRSSKTRLTQTDNG
ncbi:unnamed protein product [Caenorhabditis angaria]|uniref:Uncharacterized protein n=1 Tax=Caenorhabditis angaria TaxID=860376 RepID=A0A9P1IAW3_9PELO|nr:unnamed protein product [Caenorhabditis angaria]